MKSADSALLRAWIVHRDAEAFAQIVRRYAGLVYGSAHRILANSPDAEDVSQECFLALADAHGPAPRSLPGWLHAVATRQALKRVRGDRARERRELAQVERATEQIDPSWDDIQSYVDEAIETLPEDLRFVITAHFLLQRTHRDIAQELSVTRQAVSYRIGKGVEQIRRGLRRRGIAVPAALLGPLLEAHAHAAAPSGLAASLGKLALAGTSGRGAYPAPSSTSWSHPLLRRSALALVAVALAGTSVMMLRREEETVIVAPASPTPTSDGPVDSLPDPLAQEASEVKPDPVPAAQVESATVEEPIEEKRFDRLVTGRVYDLDTRMPIVDATVVARHTAKRLWPSGTSSTYIHSRHGKTDSMGHFQIVSLQAKRYTLRVFVRMREVVGEAPEADLRSRDEITGVEIGVSLAPADRALIEGRVTWGAGHVEGQTIQVQYDSIRREGTEDITPRGLGNTTTGTKGGYVLEEMPEGTAVLTAFSFLNGGRMTQFVDVVPGETYVVDFAFPDGADGGIEGRIDPPPGGAGTLVRAYTDNPDGVSIQWTTGASPEGYYRFRRLPEGIFEITVEPDGDRGPLIATSGAQGTIRGLTGEDEVIRVTSGLWTQRSLRLPRDWDVGPQGWTYPPRQYFASYEDVLAQSTADFVLNGYYGSDFVTVEPGMISRLDFDFGAEDDL